MTFSGGATLAIAAGCELYALNSISPGLSTVGIAKDITGQGVGFDSVFGALSCESAPSGQTFSVNVGISFVARDKNYTASTILTATIPA